MNRMLGSFAVGSLTFGLANSALAQVIASSTFDTGTDGWGLVVSTIWTPEQGNPGGCLLGSIDEPTNTTSVAFAPPAFLGSWTALDGVGELRYDYRRLSNGGGTVITFVPATVAIKGGTAMPGSQAVWHGPVVTGPSPWMTFTVPIAESAWIVNSGTWDDILSNVSELSIQIELVSSTDAPDDKNTIDNVILEVPCPVSAADLDGDCDVDAGDLAILLGAWGNRRSPADLDRDGVVGAADLAVLLGAWTG